MAPGEQARNPPFSLPTWAVRGPLAEWMRAEGERADGARVLDVGSGVKPYFPFFEPYAKEFVSVDIENPAADLQGAVEDLPVPDGSFDVVICNQVLEHCAHPAQAVRELRRVVASGGRVLASTHGVQVYHPAPDDLWRWTHAGLERLFADNGDWRSVTVTPSSGTTACVGMLISIYVEHLAKRARMPPVGRAVIAGVNRAARAIDRRSEVLRSKQPGTIHANYHVVAEA
ncbi:MAG: class I SAM-dependent methyltransferase [Thermoleophilia bacterium]